MSDYPAMPHSCLRSDPKAISKLSCLQPCHFVTLPPCQWYCQFAPHTFSSPTCSPLATTSTLAAVLARRPSLNIRFNPYHILRNIFWEIHFEKYILKNTFWEIHFEKYILRNTPKCNMIRQQTLRGSSKSNDPRFQSLYASSKTIRNNNKSLRTAS